MAFMNPAAEEWRKGRLEASAVAAQSDSRPGIMKWADRSELKRAAGGLRRALSDAPWRPGLAHSLAHSIVTEHSLIHISGYRYELYMNL